MRIPVSWLNELVNVADLTVRELADRLTFSGVEVEAIETVGRVYDEAHVVGEVRAIDRHPNADRLRLCKVFDGRDELQIVCGASNFEVGDKSCLARLGAVMPDGSKLRKAKIRGVESFGMMCAEDELGISDAHDGLYLLDRGVPAGTPLNQVLPPPETVLDLEITWNRPDCLSLIGIGREFAALLGRPLRLPDVSFESAGPDVSTLATVIVQAPADCPRYTARVITGLQDRPSPPWMRRRLELCGIRPLGLLVDVTNYVMLECGQPLHAFDHQRLADGTIIVRRAGAGEQMATLDGTPRRLEADMLVIADRREAVAVAGVMGGAGSEISAATSTVLLESALFHAPSVKSTATRLGLRTESSHRFERGLDPDLADWASRRAASLLASLGGGCVAAGVIDVDNRPSLQRAVTLRYTRCREVVGLTLDNAEMRDILVRLGLRPGAATDDACTFAIPSWRLDLEVEADLIEEVARIHGLAALPDVDPSAIAVPGVDDPEVRALAACRQTLLGFGLTEALHYSFLSAAELDAFGAGRPDRRVVLPNPVSADYGVLRDSLLPQLVSALGRNYGRQVEAPALFEIGRVFGAGDDGRPVEETRLSMGLCGPFGRGGLDRRRAVTHEEAALWLKGMIESLAAALHAEAPAFTPAENPAFEPGWAVAIHLGGKPIGCMGLVRSSLRHHWRMSAPMAVAELQLAPLLAAVGSRPPLRPVPAFPAVRRDLALVAGRGITHEAIVSTMRRAGPAELTGLELFDIFTAKELGEAKRSLAFSLEFRSPERTLTDDEVNAACQKIIAALKTELGVDVREG